MAENINKTGKSIYLAEVRGDKSFYPQYVAAREIIKRLSKSKKILELGGGDLQSTKELISSDYKITNIDISDSALATVNKDVVTLIKADLEFGIPISDVSEFDIVVALDIIEHLSDVAALDLLKEIRTKHGDDKYYIIISMPIISFKTIPTYLEFISVLMHLKRPINGLFDRTHKILKDDKWHVLLFQMAGYQVVEKYFTNCISGITGDWKNLKLDNVAYINDYKQIFLSNLISHILSPFSKTRRRQIQLNLLRHRGVYVIKPL